jgi:hypothetical protein
MQGRVTQCPQRQAYGRSVRVRAGWRRPSIRPLARSASSTLVPQAYRAASFLDDRILQSPVNAHVLPWAPVAEGRKAWRAPRCAVDLSHRPRRLDPCLAAARRAGFVLAIREPRILRDLALVPAAGRSDYIEPLRRLLSRTFEEGETALVKATSFVSESPRKSCLHQGARCSCTCRRRSTSRPFLPAKTRDRNWRALALRRAARLQERVPELALEQGTDADLAAVAWACEMTALEALPRHARRQHPLA